MASAYRVPLCEADQRVERPAGDDAATPLCLLDAELRVTGLTAAFAALLGRSAEATLGLPLVATCPALPSGLLQSLRSAVTHGSGSARVDLGVPAGCWQAGWEPLMLIAQGGPTLVFRLQPIAGVSDDEAASAPAPAYEVLPSLLHDLKNPLAAVKGMTQILQRRLSTLPEPAASFFSDGLATIEARTGTVAAQLNGLVDASRLRAGAALDLVYREGDVVALVAARVAEWQRRSPQHQFQVSAPSASIVGIWDLFRLERVLDNLLDNAVKYSPNGGPIGVELACEPAATLVTLRVRDRGVGIPAAEQSRIFSGFYRGSNVRSVGGSGLGLAGVAHIVEQHGGSISLESAERLGTTVVVRLPLRPAQAAGDLAADVRHYRR